MQRKCRECRSEIACISSGTPTIHAVEERFGFDFIQAYIEGWIVSFREFVNVGKKMTDAQTAQTAMMIVDEYRNLNIADINLIFAKAKKGLYGQIYDRLDGQIILSWFDQYFEQRCNAAALASEQEGYSHKDRYMRRGDTQQVCDRELTQILGKIKPQQL